MDYIWYAKIVFYIFLIITLLSFRYYKQEQQRQINIYSQLIIGKDYSNNLKKVKKWNILYMACDIGCYYSLIITGIYIVILESFF